VTRLKPILRFLAAVQLLPALESGEETLIGGQAVLEGVMMRSPHAWGIAVRRPSGEMAVHSEPLDRPSDKRKWLGWPVVRGLVILGQAMVLGYRALGYATNVALEEIPREENQKKIQISGWALALFLLVSLGFFIFFYKFLPLVAATELKRSAPVFGNYILFNLVDGAVRIALLLLYLWGLSRWKDIRRVFQYHGAEHKTVFAYEAARGPVSVADAQRFSTFHPRCGTSFLITVMLISMVFYTVVPVQTFWARFGLRLALLPLIIGVSYEIIRFAARHRSKPLLASMTVPGLWLQRITTQPPDDSQVECAIRALDEAMALERERGGELVIA
jgi:uncharacterized protein YqhQ